MHYTGGSKYSTPEALSWKVVLFVWAVALSVMVGGAWNLGLLTAAEPPAYTCAPGTTYTVKECP